MKRLLNQAWPAAERALKDPHRWVQPEALNVAPQLVGAPLATPLRRAWALGVDMLVVALLSGVSSLWLGLGLALVLLQLRSRRDLVASGAAEPAARTKRLVWAGWAAAALLVFLAVGEAQDRWDQWRHPEAAAADAVIVKAAPSEALAEASRALKEAQAEMAAPASVLPPASAPSADRLRIAELEAQLKEARRSKPLTWREQWSQLWDDVAAGLGWGIVYFSLLPAWWGGQTVGKKLLGLRVVELTGKPMTVMRCLKRYGGYAAGMATGGLGFAQVLWDVNRQGLQDKAAHTVVLDLRAMARPSVVVTDDP